MNSHATFPTPARALRPEFPLAAAAADIDIPRCVAAVEEAIALLILVGITRLLKSA